MKSITLALLGSAALTGAALAQTPPAPPPAPKPPAAAPAAPTPPAPAPGQSTPTAPQPGPGPQAQAAPAVPTPSGPPEGMVIETPNGLYLVRPGDSAPRRLDMGQGGPGQPGPGMAQMPQPGDEAMDDDDGGMHPPPPHPRRPPPPRPMEGKAAHFRVRTPNMNIDVKCPDDEPMKACADVVASLVDKLNAPAH